MGRETRRTPQGAEVTFATRDDVPTDAVVIREVWDQNVYGLHDSMLEGVTVVDVGANIGAFSLFAAALGARRVVAVEPEPGNLAMLRANIAANGYGAVIDVRPACVVGWPRGPVRFGGVGGEAKQVNWVFDGPVVEVDSVALAGVIPGAGPYILKVDIEGGEYYLDWDEVDWSRCRYLAMEFHAATTEDFGATAGEIAEGMRVEVVGRPSVGGMLFGRPF